MLTHCFHYFWDYWQLYHKVTFDGENKLILVNEGVTSLDFKVDVYSAWKEWVMLSSHIQNASYLEALRSVGGDPIDEPNGVFLGSTFFLRNGWRMRTWEGDHRLIVDGNVYTEEGDPAFVPIQGNFSTEIILRVSNIVDLINSESTGSTTDPAAIAAAVRAELALELSRIDVPVSSRSSTVAVAQLDTKVTTLQNDVTLLAAVADAIDSKVDYLVAASGNIDVNVVQMLTILEMLRKHNFNRTRVDPDAKTLTIYEDDQATPLITFELKDRSGNPSVTEIADRVPQ